MRSDAKSSSVAGSAMTATMSMSLRPLPITERVGADDVQPFDQPGYHRVDDVEVRAKSGGDIDWHVLPPDGSGRVWLVVRKSSCGANRRLPADSLTRCWWGRVALLSGHEG